MPSAAPPPQSRCTERLQAIGARIRERRRQLGITAVATAEAAGISRVTLHRIEAGAASVTVGALMNVLDALDLELHQLENPQANDVPQAAATIPVVINLAAYPQLRKLAWQLRGTASLSPAEAAGLYARHRRHLNLEAMDGEERQLMEALDQAFRRVHVPA
jgi:transcriptional regulator with XRE-family HTH domain